MKNIQVIQLFKSMPILNPGKFLGERSSRNFQLPPQLTASVALICVLPFFLNRLGVDFASSQYALDLAAAANLDPRILQDQLHRTLAGSFTHTILEWSAFCAAIFTTILAFAHFTIKRETTTLVIGIALLCAGIMDAFHTLAADRLIDAAVDNHNLIPFTWAICRMFNALLTIIGVSIFLFLKSEKWQGNITLVIITSLIFGLIAYQIIKISATSHTLPETIFPDSLITRPWDVAPLIIFLLAGLLIYPKFYQRYPSVFAHSLIVSTIPNAATQIHMAFGSKALFDNDFNIGHFLKIIAYLVPLTGLIIDYIKTHHQLKETNQKILNKIDERKRIEENLRRSEEMLKTKNEELNMAFIALQSTQVKLIQQEKMASLGNLVGGIAHEINNPINFIQGNLFHIEEYTKLLLDLVHLYQEEYPTLTPNIAARLEQVELEFIEEDLPRLITSMKHGSDRIRELVISLRNFSRLDEAELKKVDLHQGIESTLLILKNRLDHKITVIKEYGELMPVECYPAQLNQVWFNLLNNAIDALESERSLEPKEITIRTEMSSADLVTVRIKNNGPVIPIEIQQRMFDPFFTTKPVGSGTGLGLAIAYQVMQQHHGQISCQSNPDYGTEFALTFPVRHSKLDSAERKSPQQTFYP